MNKIFGFTQEELSSLKATYTANEIYQQPELWKETLNIVENNKEAINKFLEKNLNKDTILELYLNTSYFGDGYYCVAEASRGYYKKEPKDMNRNEASMLAGIPNAPSAYCPTKHLDLAKKRQNQVLDKMVRYEFITAKEKEEILNESNAVEDNKD